MTTIATDGKTMAADTRLSGSYIEQFEAVKLFRIGGVVYGVAGEDWSHCMAYVDWVKGGRSEDCKPTNASEFNALFVENGKVYLEGASLRPIENGSLNAIGSGKSFAMGAMLAGATPAQAVKIAMKLDPITGGKIRTMKC